MSPLPSLPESRDVVRRAARTARSLRARTVATASAARRRDLNDGAAADQADQGVQADPVAEVDADVVAPGTAGYPFVRAYWGLGRQLLGPDALPRSAAEVRFDPEVLAEMAGATRRALGFAVLTERLLAGDPLPKAQVAAVRAICERGLVNEARALALSLRHHPDGERTLTISEGVVLLTAMGRTDVAWERFADIDDTVLAAIAPVEAMTAAMSLRTPAGDDRAAAIGALAAADPAQDAQVWVEVAGRLVVLGRTEEAARVAAAARTRAEELSERAVQALDNLRRWTEPTPAEELPAGTISVGLISYDQPDVERASRNVGDYVQTLALLGNLARFRGTRFTGPNGLGELATEVQGRVRPELQLPGGDAEVRLVEVNRDFSIGDQLPPDTWTVVFGWHMHPAFRVRYGMPYHPHVKPLFVSFHINDLGLLDEETLDYLRANGPIGCRDWTTVDLLLSAGVEAFFTGCLTTTSDAVFPDRAPGDGNRVVGAVDLRPRQVRRVAESVEIVRHDGPEYRMIGLVDGVRAAIGLLEDYQQRFRRLVTSRLHCYLPASSLGVPTRLLPPKTGDVRYDGLLDMRPDSPELLGMRESIRALLAGAWELVLAGESEDTIRAHWREVTGPLVAEARERLAAPLATPLQDFDIEAAVAAVRARARRLGPHDAVVEGEVTDIAMSTDANFRDIVPVALATLVENASGPLRLWITTREVSHAYEEWLAESFPQVAMTFLPCDDIDYGEVSRMIKHITVATMDRLLLPELLDHLDRVTYVDGDTVVQGDVCELARTELDGHPLAARSSFVTQALHWRNAGNDLSAQAASDLRRAMAARHAYGARTFNAGVLVLDLARLRADRFSHEFIPMATAYGLNDQDVFNAYAGADRAPLPEHWNAWPTYDRVGEGGIVHYVGSGKPWLDLPVPEGERWRASAERFRARRGLSPA